MWEPFSKPVGLIILFCLSIICASAQTVTLYLTSSGGSFSSEKWMNITTGANGTGTVVWAQGNGTIGNGAGLLTDQAVSVPCGSTLYLNAYDKYADGWDGTIYSLRTAIGGGGSLIINNSNVSPNNSLDTDASSNWDGTVAELETSESFSVACPCEPSVGTLTSVVDDCLSGFFSVSLSVTSAGSGYSSVVVSDGVHADQTVNSFPATVTFGTYAAGETVQLNISNGTCNINSNSVLENCPVGFSCDLAEPINDGFTTTVTEVTSGNDGIENWVSSADASCGDATDDGFEFGDVKIYAYTSGTVTGESFYFTISYDEVVDGVHSIGVFSSCSGSTLSGCIGSTYEFDNVSGVCVQDMPANTTYYIAVAKEYYSLDGEGLRFDVIDFTVESSQTIPSDECVSASVIDVAQPYRGSTRCNYSASAGSPGSCGSIENDSWVKFTAGSATVIIDYEVYDCTNGDGVQLSVFSGLCGSMSLISGSCINYASNNSSGTWTFNGLTVGASYYIRTDGYAGDLCSYAFNPVSGVAILPIELVEFNAVITDENYNQLTWRTLSEINSSHFMVEQSSDGYHFTEIGRIEAAGFSQVERNYQLINDARNSTEAYYQIKCYDKDGKYTISEKRYLQNSRKDNYAIYPNPSKDGIFNLQHASQDENLKSMTYKAN